MVIKRGLPPAGVVACRYDCLSFLLNFFAVACKRMSISGDTVVVGIDLLRIQCYGERLQRSSSQQ